MVNISYSVFGYSIQTELRDEFKCEAYKFDDYSLYLASFLKDKAELKTFFECYNQKNKERNYSVIIKGQKIGLEKNEKKLFLKRSTKSIKEKKVYFSKIAKISNPKLNLQQAYELTEFFQQQNNILSKLALISVYARFNKQSKCNNMIKEILGNEASFYFVSSDISHFDQNLIYSKSLIILKQIKKNLNHEKLFNMLIYYIHNHSSDPFRSMIDDEFEIKKGLIYVNKQLKSINYGIDFIWTWGPEIYQESSFFALDIFIKELKSAEMKFKKENRILLFYRGQNKLPPKLEENFIIQLEKMYSSNSLYDKIIIKRLCEDDYFSARIKNVDNKPLRNLCSPSKLRNVYLNYLEQNYKYLHLLLVEMGDYSRENILKMMAYEQH